jgi:uncharacterized RDD family membrane protein YckC
VGDFDEVMASGGGAPVDSEAAIDAYGDVPNRLVAYALDAALLAVLAFGLVLLASRITGPAVQFDLAHDDPVARIVVDRGVALIHALLVTLLSAGYFSGSWRLIAGTPAQRLIGIRVLRARSDRPLSTGASLLRWVLLLPPFWLASLVLADVPGAGGFVMVTAIGWGAALLLTAALRRDKRGLHDLASGSVVVKRSVPRPRPRAP